MIVQRGLDLGRIDVKAAVDDQLFAAPQNMQPPILIKLAQIAGVQPAFGVDRFVGLCRVAVVALHHMRAAHQHLTFARPIAAGRLVVNFAFSAGRDRPDRGV